MNKRTIYTLPKDTDLTGTILAQLIEAHKADKATFATLESYVDDDPKINRTLPNDLLTINNFAQYIVDVNVGYLLGNPVDYKADKKQNIEPIMDNFKTQSISELDNDLGEDLSMFGQAFENVFVDETSTVLSAKLSPYNTIVAYDDTFKHNKMYAIYYAQLVDDKGKDIADSYTLTIWTPNQTLYRVLNKQELAIDPDNADTSHFYGEVPVIHYMNNKRLKGDYEPVISLIDAYNILQSDRVIDREKLVDAILAFYGGKLTEEDRQAIKDNRVVGLPSDAKAEYIVKTINEADTDVLRKVIASDIHKFSKTPDFTDDKFGNNPSGVSLKYKILSLEWNAKKKERQFSAGLLDRFRLYSKMMTTMSKINGQPQVEIVFTRSLPKNDFETSQMITNLEGMVSDETLIGQLSFVNDASAEADKAAKQKEANLANSNFASGNFSSTKSVDTGVTG